MTGERVTKSRQKAQQEGRKRLSAILSADASQRYERLKGERSEAQLIEAALKALEGANELTDQELIDTLQQRLRLQSTRTFNRTNEKPENLSSKIELSSKIITPPKR